jgi:hypothetical protein
MIFVSMPRVPPLAPLAPLEIESFEDDREDDRRLTSSERFDRLAFAERALALVRPRGMTVALCAGDRRIHIEHGRQWGKAAGSSWAILAVPPNASRRAIVNAILTLVAYDPLRLHENATHPYRAWTLDLLFDVLLAA